jgi:hypothetical protein
MKVSVRAEYARVAEELESELSAEELRLLEITAQEAKPEPFETSARRGEPLMTIVISGIVGGAAYDLVKYAVTKAYEVLARKFGPSSVTRDDGQ